VAEEQVRVWRPLHQERVLLMKGMTTEYKVEPRGEHFFGVITAGGMRLSRGSETRVVAPGELVTLDPSLVHSGNALDGQPWTARLMVLESTSLARLARDADDDPLADVSFPQPVLADRDLAHSFLRLHAALSGPTSRLEQDELLAAWLRTLVERAPGGSVRRARLSPRDDRAIRRACEYLAERPERNVSLDELASAAGIGKFRLVRLFRERTGLAPHALQVAHRIRAARRLLEAGETIASTAAQTGFADQSHLHRHFQRTLGVTPGEYQRRLLGSR
jgi:AraC-like DNA-binding protein